MVIKVNVTKGVIKNKIKENKDVAIRKSVRCVEIVTLRSITSSEAGQRVCGFEMYVN